MKAAKRHSNEIWSEHFSATGHLTCMKTILFFYSWRAAAVFAADVNGKWVAQVPAVAAKP